jgi:hypothetical protein
MQINKSKIWGDFSPYTKVDIFLYRDVTITLLFLRNIIIWNQWIN